VRRAGIAHRPASKARTVTPPPWTMCSVTLLAGAARVPEVFTLIFHLSVEKVRQRAARRST